MNDLVAAHVPIPYLTNSPYKFKNNTAYGNTKLHGLSDAFWHSQYASPCASLLNKGAQISAARSPWQLNFVRWRQVFGKCVHPSIKSRWSNGIFITFLFSKKSRPDLGHKRTPIQWVKCPRRDVDHSHPSSAEVRNEWRYAPTPPICLHNADRDTCTFTLISLPNTQSSNMTSINHMKAVAKRTICANTGNRILIVQRVASHFSDWATAAHAKICSLRTSYTSVTSINPRKLITPPITYPFDTTVLPRPSTGSINSVGVSIWRQRTVIHKQTKSSLCCSRTWLYIIPDQRGEERVLRIK
jgi:hypothetical protein